MSFGAKLAGEPVDVEILPNAVRAGEIELSYVDIDEVFVDEWTVTMRGPAGSLVLEKLGRGRDDFLHELRAARLPARRAALLQSGVDAPIDLYEAKRGDEPILVGLHADGLTVEADAGIPVYVPLSCVTGVVRKDYDIIIKARSLADVALRQLGRRTDEFLADLERARRSLEARTREAYEALDPALASLDAPDGWAVTKDEAGSAWEPLRAAFAGMDRAIMIDVLSSQAGERLRIGVKAAFAGATMPFALAPCGRRVVVESAGDEDRATFVFETDDVDRLNLALLLTSFRREALFLPEEKLGRWSVAVRLLEIVRWARGALVSRIIHNEGWEEKLRAAVGS
jgi:hypothetical protein